MRFIRFEDFCYREGLEYTFEKESIEIGTEVVGLHMCEQTNALTSRWAKELLQCPLALMQRLHLVSRCKCLALPEKRDRRLRQIHVNAFSSRC